MLINYFFDLIPFVNMLSLSLNHVILYVTSHLSLIFSTIAIIVVSCIRCPCRCAIFTVFMFVRISTILVWTVCLTVLWCAGNVSRFSWLDCLVHYCPSAISNPLFPCSVPHTPWPVYQSAPHTVVYLWA